MLRGAFLDFLERPRACSVEHTSPAEKIISVVVITIRLLGYNVSCIWNCEGWSEYFPVVPSWTPHRVPYLEMYLLRQ